MIDASAKLAAKLVPHAIFKLYPGGSHSLGDISKEQLNADLLGVREILKLPSAPLLTAPRPRPPPCAVSPG